VCVCVCRSVGWRARRGAAASAAEERGDSREWARGGMLDGAAAAGAGKLGGGSFRRCEERGSAWRGTPPGKLSTVSNITWHGPGTEKRGGQGPLIDSILHSVRACVRVRGRVRVYTCYRGPRVHACVRYSTLPGPACTCACVCVSVCLCVSACL